MLPRRRNIFLLLMALLLAAQPFLPTGGWAEAEMRCAGASPSSAPCAQAELPATGLTERAAYHALMACCRARRGCAGMRGGERALPASHRATLSARHCVITLRAISAGQSLTAPPRSQRVQAAAPALAPSPAAPAVSAVFPAPSAWTLPPTLSPHSLPTLHGLRAPPAA